MQWHKSTTDTNLHLKFPTDIPLRAFDHAQKISSYHKIAQAAFVALELPENKQEKIFNNQNLYW